MQLSIPVGEYWSWFDSMCSRNGVKAIYLVIASLSTVLVVNMFIFYDTWHVFHEHIDLTFVNSLHSLLNYEIGGLDCRVITTDVILFYKPTCVYLKAQVTVQ